MIPKPTQFVVQTATGSTIPPEPPRPLRRYEEPMATDFPAAAVTKYPAHQWDMAWKTFQTSASGDNVPRALLLGWGTGGWRPARRDANDPGPDDQSALYGFPLGSVWHHMDAVLCIREIDRLVAERHDHWEENTAQMGALAVEQNAAISAAIAPMVAAAGVKFDQGDLLRYNEVKISGKTVPT
jgi:hypothetical protein